jgi:hypothetical protein
VRLSGIFAAEHKFKGGSTQMRSILITLLAGAVMSLTALAADVTGKWSGEQQGRNGPRTVTFDLKQDGAKLTGSTTGFQGQTQEISEGKVEGDNVSWVIKIERNGNEMKMMYSGTVAGGEMKLKVQREGAENARELVLKRAQ